MFSLTDLKNLIFAVLWTRHRIEYDACPKFVKDNPHLTRYYAESFALLEKLRQMKAEIELAAPSAPGATISSQDESDPSKGP